MKLRTTYIGPVGFKGSRIRARMNGRQLTVPYDHASTDPHKDTAVQLAWTLFPVAEVKAIDMTANGYVYEVTEVKP